MLFLFTVFVLFQVSLIFLVMDLEQLSVLLGGVGQDHLASGFASLLELFPASSCESMQMVNVLLPLLLDSIRPFFHEEAMVQVNCYFYVKVHYIYLIYHNQNRSF